MTWCSPEDVSKVLAENHYLGPIKRGFAWQDQYGVLVFANPSSRRLPQDRWLELVRWCITSKERNAGSRQWAAVAKDLRECWLKISTIISYSDPRAGHTGSLYRACNWRWAPTWLRLRPPPTGNGNWGKESIQSVKDRWVFLLAPDSEREGLLAVQDGSIMRRMPWASFKEPNGADYRKWVGL